MARVPLLRPLASDDAPSLGRLDEEHSRRTGEERLVEESVVVFFSRTGHSFVAEEGGETSGFVLAQAVWNGRRPAVTVHRLAASDHAVRIALLEALTKSAYDAGVYDIEVVMTEEDAEGALALEDAGYSLRPSLVYRRVLGSRGSAGGQGGAGGGQSHGRADDLAHGSDED